MVDWGRLLSGYWGEILSRRFESCPPRQNENAPEQGRVFHSFWVSIQLCRVLEESPLAGSYSLTRSLYSGCRRMYTSMNSHAGTTLWDFSRA